VRDQDDLNTAESARVALGCREKGELICSYRPGRLARDYERYPPHSSLAQGAQHLAEAPALILVPEGQSTGHSLDGPRAEGHQKRLVSELGAPVRDSGMGGGID
jgi:hypothetical protein